MEKSVLGIARVQLNDVQYKKFCVEYNRTYKFVKRLKVSTQFSIISNIIA